jgi:alpha-glucoside transport system substrate-binding protein
MSISMLFSRVYEPMRRRRVRSLIALGLAASFLAAACTSVTSEPRPIVEVFGPYRGDEAAKFAASFAPFEDETGYDVRYVGTGSFATDVQDRVAETEYPDVAIFPQPALLSDLASRGLLATLPESIAADVFGVGRDPLDETLAAHAVWFRGSAKSLVWYLPTEFEEHGYELPTTWDELMALSGTMVEDGIAPWCLSIESFASSGWVGTDWIEDIVLREQGTTFYDRWVAGDISFDTSEIRHAFSTFGSVVHGRKTVLGGTNTILNTPWQDAAKPMFEDQARCMMHRQASSWATNIPDGFILGRDIDFFILPGATHDPAPMLVSGELAAAFNDRPEVAEFMEYLATPAAGEEWAKLGGFISPHPDFDTDQYAFESDRKVGQAIHDAPSVRFDGSDQMPPVVGTGTFWEAMRSYIRTGDIDAAVMLVDDSWPRATPYTEDDG